MKQRVAEFIASQWSVPVGALEVDVRPLRGGLESSVSVARVAAGPHRRLVPTHLVVKELKGELRREAEVYQLLWDQLPEPPAARALGIESAGEAAYLYLERIRPLSSWPWSDSAVSAEVCRELARLHDSAALRSPIFDWGYEHELACSSVATLALARHARDERQARCWRRLGDLRRAVAALPSIREHLVRSGVTIIHGDVHPGNVIVRNAKTGGRVVLIDWGRARAGSPLEDVASWLHSVGCWEPQARRRHDTLLRAYLDSRRVPQRMAGDLRRLYWFASASNGLAGAIRYHLAVLSNRASPARARRNSQRALREWERVIRRTASLLTASAAD
jgi:aminoglycoside phosphotransferase (APT) family kinase protein